MIRLNEIKNKIETIVGQLYDDERPLNDVMVVQFNRALSLNTGRSWENTGFAGDNFYIKPLSMTVWDVTPVTAGKFDLSISASSI